MPDEAAAAFWSYTHDDDGAEQGRIVRLAEHLRAEFAAVTAEDLRVFVDRESIAWGDQWRLTIDQALAGATFFIPIVTPRFFRSQECRRELLKFASEADRLGLIELLLPVYWISVRELDETDPVDEAMSLIARTHWQDLRPVRLLDETSSEYRQAVNRLAVQLAERVEHLSAAPTEIPADVAPAATSGVTDAGALEDEEPGEMEVLAEGEEALEHLTPLMDGISHELNAVGELATTATEELRRADARGAGFAGRLRVTERFAQQLDPGAQRLAELGQQYGAELVKVDAAMSTLIAAALNIGPDASPEDRASAEGFLSSTRELVATAETSIAELHGFVESTRETAKLSRTLRRPLRRLETGLQGVMDAEPVMQGWLRRIEEGPEPPLA